MSSGRAFLRISGTGVALTLAGCLNSAQRVEEYIQFKLIDGLREEQGRTTEIPIINVDASYANDTPPDLVHLDEEWADQFPIPENRPSRIRFTTR